MASQYMVVQYVPSVIAGEKINFGLVAMEGEKIESKFIDSWDRIEGFSDEDVSFLKNFARSLSNNYRSVEELRKMSSCWLNSIQLTTPRSSTPPLQKLLAQQAPNFLKS